MWKELSLGVMKPHTPPELPLAFYLSEKQMSTVFKLQLFFFSASCKFILINATACEDHLWVAILWSNHQPIIKTLFLPSFYPHFIVIALFEPQDIPMRQVEQV